MAEEIECARPADKGSEQAGEEPASFEQNLARLEQIVSLLEEGNKGLDESLALFEEGIDRYRLCNERLAQLEVRIKKLVDTLEGQVREEPFELPAQ